MKVAVLGSGNGALATAFEWARAGHDIYMFDFPQFDKQINAINQAGGIYSEGQMEGFQPIKYAGHDIETCLKDAELILVSVGGQNLKDVGTSLADLLKDEKHYYIITAENASHPSKTLKEAIGKKNISVSESTVFCTTIEDGGLDINSENFAVVIRCCLIISY